MLFLGIESTCDETAAAVVKDGSDILSQVIESSSDLHKSYGGVFPELACRYHVDVILPVIDAALKKAEISPKNLDCIAVANEPGLIGALFIGLSVAKGLCIAWKKPLIGINHIEAHLYASMMNSQPSFPALGFVLSGGHTLLLKISSIGEYELLGTTVDDAIGEAFDKVASMLGISYPGGPQLEILAKKGNPLAYPFSISNVKKYPLSFSFSGLKTAVFYILKKLDLAKESYADIAASFQYTAFKDLLFKAELAFRNQPYRSIVFGGGVCTNQALRELFSVRFPNIPLFWPPEGLSTDNAAMIAGLAYHKFLRKKQGDPLTLEAHPRSTIIGLLRN